MAKTTVVQSAIHEEESFVESVDDLKAQLAKLEDEMVELLEQAHDQKTQLAKSQARVLELETENSELLDLSNDLEAQLGESQARVAQLEAKNAELVASQQTIETLELRLTEAEARFTKLAESLEANRELMDDVRSLTIDEEKELDLPTTPPKLNSYPRPSIGQWSVDRVRKNMSVRSLVSSMESKRRT